ncbi:expressed unknown protein [Seminavis robusta]|uniref:Uncharacterized protein n=1 Tax=Seminavis robusta TaxID=568900 RepID=A0A9N8E666_9STRA|nr:expressed unknown protein [Seminavis robusta]|eukprot:Sro539_g162750.1 n/a (139) ;mRNA; f:5820-6236
MLNVDMNLFLNLDPYMADDGSVVIPPEDERPASAPSNCGTDGRIWAVCFPERTTDSNTVVETFDGPQQDNSFLSEFAVVYDMMLSRVTDSATLAAVQESAPEGFPGSLPRGGGDCFLGLNSVRNAWNSAMSLFGMNEP